MDVILLCVKVVTRYSFFELAMLNACCSNYAYIYVLLQLEINFIVISLNWFITYRGKGLDKWIIIFDIYHARIFKCK